MKCKDQITWVENNENLLQKLDEEGKAQMTTLSKIVEDYQSQLKSNESILSDYSFQIPKEKIKQ